MAEDFVISVDMQGQGPMDFSFQELSAGPHKVRIEGIEDSNEKKGSYRFTVSDQEEGSETSGLSGLVIIGKDFSKKGNRGHLACLLVGMGLPPDKIRGKVEFKGSQLIGKTTYIIVVPPAEGELDDSGRTPFASKNFVTKEMYDAAKKVGAAMKSRKAAPIPATTIPTNGAAQTKAPAATTAPEPAEPAPEIDVGNLFGNG
jgi:hypothetical protein